MSLLVVGEPIQPDAPVRKIRMTFSSVDGSD
jgi:hypothetical protein